MTSNPSKTNGDDLLPGVMKILRNGGQFFSWVLFLSGVPAFGLRGSPGSRIFKRTVIPAGARAVVGGTDFRSLTRPFRGSSFLPASARGEPESRLWRVFANGARRNVRAPNCWKAGVCFPVIGVLVPSKCRSLRFGGFGRRPPPRCRDLNGSLDSGSPRALSSATPPDVNGLSRMREVLARLGKRALRPE